MNWGNIAFYVAVAAVAYFLFKDKLPKSLTDFVSGLLTLDFLKSKPVAADKDVDIVLVKTDTVEKKVTTIDLVTQWVELRQVVSKGGKTEAVTKLDALFADLNLDAAPVVKKEG